MTESSSRVPAAKAFIPRQTTEDAALQRAGVPAELPPVNFLEMIFSAQKHLMAKYHPIEKANGAAVVTTDLEGKLDDRQVQARMHELFGYLVRELGEAMQELKNKPWKVEDRPTDHKAFVSEMGDCLHFFVEMCITAGMTADDLHRAYFREFQKNNQRIDSGTY